MTLTPRSGLGLRLEINGTGAAVLAEVRRTGRDVLGNPVQPFVDREGGWPLRCCLRDSEPGEVLALIAWCPFDWSGPFAEVGPVVVHHEGCAPVTVASVPVAFLGREQVVRPYRTDHQLAYDHIRVVAADGSLPQVLDDLLARPDIEEVVARNVLAGCYSFTARRASTACTVPVDEVRPLGPTGPGPVCR
jgi:hypothetical protein